MMSPDLQAQMPAQGILKQHDWGQAKVYRVTCSCTDSDHDHNFWVEANEDGEISATIYTTTVTTFWSVNRWQQIWQLLTRGYIKSEVSISMTQQQTLNYAETLKCAIQDIRDFQDQSHGNS